MKQKKLGGEISSIKNLFNRNVENSEVFRYVNMITSTNSFILGFLERHQDIDIYQKNIEEKFLITKSTTSKILKLMEQNGLIERIGVDSDARLKKIVLTDESVRSTLDEVEKKALEGFEPHEITQLYSYFERIKNNLKK